MKRALAYIQVMRPHQWLKNGFVFMGLVFGHAWHDPHLVRKAILTFVAFSLVSSSVYILNDIFDRRRDLGHPQKSLRPIASGVVSVMSGALLAAALSSAGGWIAFTVSGFAIAILGFYVVMNLVYSGGLKNVVILDVFFISAGFMLRILAGTTGLGIPPSRWLLLCGLMITLFLGFAKRRAELAEVESDRGNHRPVLALYTETLLDKFITISGTTVIVSYSLYTMSPETIQTHHTENLIYTVPFIVYAIFRYVFLLHVDNRGGEPSRDLVRDGHIVASVIAWACTTLWLIG